MLNIIKNETIFPEYIKLNICLNLVDEINNIILQYKSNVNDAVIYSLIKKNDKIYPIRLLNHKLNSVRCIEEKRTNNYGRISC